MSGRRAARSFRRPASCTAISISRCSGTRRISRSRRRGRTTGTRAGVRRQDQGPPDRIRPGQPAVGLCADHGGEAEGRRRGQHGPRLGAAEGAEAVGRRQRHGIGRGGAVFRERPGVAFAVLERAVRATTSPTTIRWTSPSRRRARSGWPTAPAVPVGADNKKLAFEFINFRLDPEVQRAFYLAYHSSPGRPDITDWPADFAATQIVTEQKMAERRFPRQRGDRQQAQRLDAQVAGDHELMPPLASGMRPASNPSA